MRSASVVITNYNYGRFLAAAIESALDQTRRCEVIVVDDGSTDDSADVIARYSKRIVHLSIEHGGQGAAFNAGFQVSTGEVVCFLDSDDVLLGGALEDAIPHFDEPAVTKVHWMLEAMDEGGARLGELIPELPLPHGDLRGDVLRKGPGGYVWSPTSGNAWSRRFLERVLPMPPERYVTCAETYLSLWAPLLGTVAAVRKVNGLYREHGGNNRYAISEQQIRTYVEHSRQVLDDYLRAEGIEVDVEEWLRAFRWPDRDQAVGELAAVMGSQERFVLVDRGQWGESFEIRPRALRFPEDGGGAAEPQKQLASWRKAGASFVAVAWPAFDWLESGAAMPSYLRSNLRPALANARVVLFELPAS